MIILPFLFSIPRDQADMNLLEKMMDEKDAIVSTCLRAYRRVIKNNCQFSACDAADEMNAEWRGIRNYIISAALFISYSSQPLP